MPPASDRAVFLSYASQDAEAARRICEALRTAGVEVWFDQNELVGGDAWDAKIRKQIAECALFVPLISANTQARLEGYFRIEWKLAAQRTHAMAEEKSFLLPVLIDATRDSDAKVPGEFKTVQWTKLPGGETSEKFCARVKTLLGGEEVPSGSATGERLVRAQEDERGPAAPLQKTARSWIIPAVVGIGLLAAVAALFALRPRRSPEEVAKLITGAQTAAANATVKSATADAPLSEARKLVAHAREILEDGDDSNHETLLLAEELLKKAQALDSTDGDVWAAEAQLSRLMLIVGFDRSLTRRELLKQQAERAITLSPKSIEAQIAYAGFLSQTGRAGAVEAVRRLDPLTKQYPSNRALFLSLGLACSTAGDADGAARAFDQANALPGGDANALAQKGTQMIWHGRYADSEQAMAQSLAVKETGRADVFGVLLKLCWRGDLDGAAAAVERWPAWLKVEPRGAIMASQVWMWRREPDKAIAALKAVASETWNDTLFTGPKSVLLALAYEMANQPQAARAEWENAKLVAERQIADDSTNRASLVYKACALVRLGDSAAAEKILREVEQSKDLRSEFWSCAAPSALLRILLGHGAEVAVKFDAEQRSPRIEQAYPSPRAALQLNPVFDSIRATPEFQKWMAAAPAPMETTASATPDAAKADDKSVAVLAFADNSPGRDSEYFSDGISEELINALGKVPGLKVPARTSSFFFKGKSVPVPEIAKQLGVAYVIEGSVQRAGDKVKISARLSKAADGFQVWTDTFLRDAKDIFTVEEEIAGLIAKNLSLKLGVSSAAATASVNPEAFGLYLQGRQALYLRRAEGYALAEQLLNRAIELAPDFARAHATLGDLWIQRAQDAGTIGSFGDRNSPEAARIAAKARQALALDPSSAEAHTLMGSVHTYAWQTDEAAREHREAIALNPTYAPAHQRLGRALVRDGRMDEGLAELKLAAELDPLASRFLDNYAGALRQAGRYSESLIVAERAIAAQPDNIQGPLAKSRALLALGRADEAVVVVRGLTPDSDFAILAMVEVLAIAGRQADAEAQLSRVKTLGSRFLGLAALGRRGDSVAAFDVQRLSSIAFAEFLFEPSCDPIRDDPRIAQGLATLGLTEAHARAQAWRRAHPPEKPTATK